MLRQDTLQDTLIVHRRERVVMKWASVVVPFVVDAGSASADPPAWWHERADEGAAGMKDHESRISRIWRVLAEISEKCAATVTLIGVNARVAPSDK